MHRRISAAIAAAGLFLTLPIHPMPSAAAGYTLTDLTHAAAHLAGRTQLTTEEIQRLDLTGDGDVGLADLVRLAQQCGSSSQSAKEEDAAVAASLTVLPDAVHAEILSCALADGDAMYEVRALSHGGTYTIGVAADDFTVRYRDMQRDPNVAYSGHGLSRGEAEQAVVLRVPGATQSDIVSARTIEVQGKRAFEIHVRTRHENVTAVLMAATGEIVRWYEDLVPLAADAPPALGTAPPSPDGLLSGAEAAKIAAAQVPGASTSDVAACDLNTFTLPAVYTVHLVYDDASYTFVIGAYDAKVLCEFMTRAPRPGLPQAPLSEDEAMQFVVDRMPGTASVQYAGVYPRQTDFGTVFDVHAEYSDVTYDASLVAATGELIFWEVEGLISHPVPDPIREIAPPR